MKKDTNSARLRHDPFPALLRSFFQDWLAEQRNASVHTIRSYRDTWRLFLRFVAGRKRKEVAEHIFELTGLDDDGDCVLKPLGVAMLQPVAS